MAKNASRILLIVLSSLAGLLLAASVAAGFYMVDYALVPKKHGRDLENMGHKWEKRMPGSYMWYKNLHESGVFRDTTLVNDRGFRLHAVYAPAARPSRAEGTAVLVHGYTDNHISMMNIARIYRDSLNFNVLVMDQQFHGLSEGNSIQMGWLDRLNAAMWAEAAHDIFGNDFLVMHGVSMGGATVMMLSGGPDPDCITAYVEDCGYTSVWNQFAKQLREEFSMPPFPVLHIANLICRHRYGWDLKEASSISQLAKSTKPMLFIHGDTDHFVPTSDVYKCYDAKENGYKKLWLCPNAGHAKSDWTNPAGYTGQLRAFLGEVRALSDR